MASLKQYLSNTYRRIKKNCCPEWVDNRHEFYIWYERQFKKQKGLCKYCNLPGDTAIYYKQNYFRDGKRGHRLEVDKKNNDKRYSPDNCVLACYPCNNAKSDVFTYKEFLEIGKTIHKVKKRN